MQPFNKYYPPDWTPDKGTANKFVGKHPLGDRARKLDKGILIVRFELPFNIWCTGCDNHIGKAYVVVSGAREKVETWTADKDDHVATLNDEAIKEKLAEDPIYRLEHGLQDKSVGLSNVPVLTQLQQLSNAQWKDPYTQSQQLRRKFRQEKKKDQQILEQTNQLKDKHSLHIDLLPESETDSLEAKMVDFSGKCVYNHHFLSLTFFFFCVESGRTRIEQQKLQASTAPLFGHNGSNTSTLSDTTKRVNHHRTALQKDNKSTTTIHPKQVLGQRALLHTKRKTDPFLQDTGFKKPSNNTSIPSSSASSVTESSLHGVTVRPVKKKKVEMSLVNYPDSD
ncbi:uncharacterized protein BX664DRAFT_253996 [Halteromyces radiatus]|uniref:uncharacterized protein n=1 Tax=Halteromyces radiatus TaxID=101107 RepID=UPI00221E8E99|nr:uncharacterized protein BX664DRAFT_253996 [Halteromyces radiatus]KAI8099429.1 hypothetical protein BX664DRAFT_253996 [Halteromyces radiatus]